MTICIWVPLFLGQRVEADYK